LEALAYALKGATEAGQWAAVEVLAAELRERRRALAGVVELEAERKRRGVT
jgi:hypothetical protein